MYFFQVFSHYLDPIISIYPYRYRTGIHMYGVFYPIKSNKKTQYPTYSFSTVHNIFPLNFFYRSEWYIFSTTITIITINKWNDNFVILELFSKLGSNTYQNCGVAYRDKTWYCCQFMSQSHGKIDNLVLLRIFTKLMQMAWYQRKRQNSRTIEYYLVPKQCWHQTIELNFLSIAILPFNFTIVVNTVDAIVSRRCFILFDQLKSNGTNKTKQNHVAK